MQRREEFALWGGGRTQDGLEMKAGPTWGNFGTALPQLSPWHTEHWHTMLLFRIPPGKYKFSQGICKPRMGMCVQEQKCISHRVCKVYPKAKQKDCRNREVSELCHPLGKVPQDNPGVWDKSNSPAQIQPKTVPSPRQTRPP